MKIPNTDVPKGAEIVFGHQDKANFYQFDVLGSGDSYSRWNVMKGDPEAEYGLSPIWLDKPWLQLPPVSDSFTLRVDVHAKESATGKSYGLAYCYVDEVRIGSVGLSDYTGGQVGVVAIASPGQGGLVLSTGSCIGTGDG